jgi:hypothetical protein
MTDATEHAEVGHLNVEEVAIQQVVDVEKLRASTNSASTVAAFFHGPLPLPIIAL